MTGPRHLRICIVGAGPRGLSVLERLCAQERHDRACASLTVHVVDPAAPGAGAVWRTDQSRLLLTNTVASQITVYTDPSCRLAGPIEPGPSLYEWARSVASAGPWGALDPDVLDEARALGPDDYPTRAFYGHYLRASFRRIVRRAPPHVSIRCHRSRAVASADTSGVPGGPQGVRLADGTRLHHLDAVVLALGHAAARLDPRQARTASLSRVHGLTYLPQANPADVDLGHIPAGAPVLLRGLGLTFFDHLILLTVGRGGSFTEESGRLRYRPSGAEPRLSASSRRGIPAQARGDNQKGVTGRHLPRLLTAQAVARLRARRARGESIRFRRDVWPLIAAEVESVYYATLLRRTGHAGRAESFTVRYLATPAERRPALLDEYPIPPARRWDWDRLAHPYRGREFRDRDDFRAWALDHLARDVAHARAGNVDGPLKAALDVLRDLRNEIRLAVDHGGIDGDSYRDELTGWFTPFNAFLSIGPPARRIEETIALIEAGVLELTGPDTQIVIDTETPAFEATSRTVPGPPVRAGVLIEARLPEPDLRGTADPLLRHMLDTEQCRPYRIPYDGGTYETGGLAVTERPYRVVDAQDQPHPRRFAFGVPTESVHWVTAAGIRPGNDSVILADADAIAAEVRSLAPAGHAVADRAASGSARFPGVIV
ncbi:FAD/NAD(P)-binding domain-containing protein [Micromonospora sp. D75]|uniref:FAD/NAD(P)-binding protein n=1 Tax=Micromonospora sp. D75 TaxID=2824885 RepID=UPI001B387C5D|nr:FAD/NAD(P)-binding protein [Micromonospora sp. D75]MBQ1068464.1 FAD/NAD(P)-binding protein [Micromonospora sp. D75]